MKPILPAFILLIAILTACTDSNSHTSSESQTKLSDTTSLMAVPDAYASKDTSESLPVDSGFLMKILTVGTFHSDEVWTGADKEK